MFIKVREWLIDRLRVDASRRNAPGQSARWKKAPPPMADVLAFASLNPWVGAAVANLAEPAALSKLLVKEGDRVLDNHPLLDLLGELGRPNDGTSVIEYWETVFSHWLLTGNCFLYWWAAGGGVPTETHVLDPRYVFIQPGAGRMVQHYEYWCEGQRFILPPECVTHVKRFHPFNRYYGMSLLEALRLEVRADLAMADWNYEFFGDGVALPAGILVVDEHTSAQERERIEAEMEALHGYERRTMVVPAPVGSAVWYDAGAKHRDLDFIEGRGFTRKAVYEVLGYPAGLLAETSTEAHARVAERRLLQRIWQIENRFGRSLSADVMPFFSTRRNQLCVFEDVRQTDWAQEEAKWRVNQIRSELGEDLVI